MMEDKQVRMRTIFNATRRRPMMGSITLIAALGMAACGASSTSPQSSVPGVTASTITFGQTAPQSGPAALYGQSTAGIDAYFNYVNDHGGALGRKLKLISLDDQYQPPVALQATRQLMGQVFAEVGLSGTATSQAAITLLGPAGVPVVGPQTGAPTFSDTLRPFLYNVWPSYSIEGKLLGTYAMSKLHLHKIGVLYQNDDFGKTEYSGLQAAGLQAALTIPYDPTQSDFGPDAQQFKTAGVDGVIILAIPKSTISFLNALSAIHFTPARLMSQVSAIPQSFNSAPDEFPGSYVGAFVPPLTETSNVQVKVFLDSMAKHEAGKPASIFAAWGWIEAQVAVAGLSKVSGELTRTNYERALDSLTDFQTMGGLINYSANRHTGLQDMFMLRAENGSFVPVG